MNIGHHKIFVHGFIHISSLTAKLDILVERKQTLDIWLPQILSQEGVRVFVISGDIININTPRSFHNIA